MLLFRVESQIIVRSHGFVVKRPTRAMIPVIYEFSRLYTTYTLGFNKEKRKKEWVPYKTFGIYVDGGMEYRFHREQLEEFLRLLKMRGVHESSYTVEYEAMYVPDKVDIALNGSKELYDYQVKALEYICEEGDKHRNKMVMLKTGLGKSLTSLAAACQLGYRTAIICLGGYLTKWKGDVLSNLTIDKSDIFIIQGSEKLMKATHMPGTGAIPKVFIISVNTLREWFKLYEENVQHPLLDAYGCRPTDLYEHLGIGTVILDEVHQHLHAVFKTFAYMHVPKSIGLSATLISKDQVVHRVHSMMFPRHKRFDDVKTKNYIRTHACSYHIQNFNMTGIQTTEWNSAMYSHVAFERSLLSKKRRNVLRQYFGMIKSLVDEGYMRIRTEGDKLAIFVSTKHMAEEMVVYLKRIYPELDIRTYLQENDYNDVLEPDIRVTTILSAGTAVDIPGLRTSILTISIDSPTANLQVFGRLRELKREKDNDVHFYYVYCSDIKKQVQYHFTRAELLRPRSRRFKYRDLGTIYTDRG